MRCNVKRCNVSSKGPSSEERVGPLLDTLDFKVRLHTVINRADFVSWCMLYIYIYIYIYIYTYEGNKMHSCENDVVLSCVNH